MSAITAYPLAWPHGWRRTEPSRRTYGKFVKKTVRPGNTWSSNVDVTMSQACDRVRAELERMGVRHGDLIISTNVVLRLDGFPRSDQRAPEDPGVAVYWTTGKDKQPRCIAVDLYTKVEQNVAAIAATLDAMRAIERHGGAEIGQRAYTGFQALPAPGGDSARGWRTVLGFTEAERPDITTVEGRYRKLISEAHPDRGGDPAVAADLNEARDQARKELGT